MGYLSNRRRHRHDQREYTDIAVLFELIYTEDDDAYADLHDYDDLIPTELHYKLENEEAIDGDEYEDAYGKVCSFKEGVFTKSAVGSLIMASIRLNRELTDDEVVEIVMPYIVNDVREELQRMLRNAINNDRYIVAKLGKILTV